MKATQEVQNLHGGSSVRTASHTQAEFRCRFFNGRSVLKLETRQNLYADQFLEGC